MGNEIQQRHLSAENFPRLRRRLDAETEGGVKLFQKDGFSTRGDKPVTLMKSLEWRNFESLAAGTRFATQNNSHMQFEVTDNANQLVTHQHFKQVGEHIVLTKPVISAIFTTELEVIQKDRLRYFMEPAI